METFAITPNVPDGYVIAAFRKITSDHTGTASITHFSSGGSTVTVSLHNHTSQNVSFVVEVEVYCVPTSI